MRAAAPELLPWGTHAYVISAAQAERMARLADLLLARSMHPVDDMHSTTWQLDGEDVKIDHFLSLVYSNLTLAADRSRRAKPLLAHLPFAGACSSCMFATPPLLGCTC